MTDRVLVASGAQWLMKQRLTVVTGQMCSLAVVARSRRLLALLLLARRLVCIFMVVVLEVAIRRTRRLRGRIPPALTAACHDFVVYCC